jgi:ankyrin repeat protein
MKLRSFWSGAAASRPASSPGVIIMKIQVVVQLVLGLLVLASATARSLPMQKPGDAEILKAAQAGDTVRLAALLDRGADVDAADENAATPLILAAINGHTDAVALLVSKGARIEARDVLGRTALLWCLDKGSGGLARMLLEKGAQAKVVDKHGAAPVELALKTDLPTLTALLDHGADPSATGSSGDSALFLAILGKKISMALLLIGRGANVNYGSAWGVSPLVEAIGLDDALLVRMLLVRRLLLRGADPNRGGGENGVAPLIAAVRKGDIAIVKLLLDHKANINLASSRDGTTPLMHAVEARHVPIVKLLLSRGANANATDQAHQTALTRALKGKDSVSAEIAGLLRKSRATR